jgi:hypothetical protein
LKQRIRIGDLVEIPTSRGLAYAQYSHHKDRWGALLRVLPGFHRDRPRNFEHLVRSKARFVTFFPLGAAMAQGIFEIVGNEPVPVEAQRFPLFRKAGFVDREGRVQDWLLWDGENEWKVGKLSSDQRQLPILAVWNDTLLVERIEQEWLPGTDRR